MAETYRQEFAQTKATEVEKSWSDTLSLMAENYRGTLVGNPQDGLLVVRAEGINANFRNPMEEMEPFCTPNILFTKFGPVIAWVSPAYVSWQERMTYWQKPEVREAILKFAKDQLLNTIAEGRPRYEHEMRTQTNLSLPGFVAESEAGKGKKSFLLVNPLDEKLGDACLENLQRIHNHNQEVELVELNASFNAAAAMAAKFSAPPAPQTQN